MGRKLLFTLVLAIAGTMPFYGQPVHRMTVNVKKPGTDIAPTMYGLFFEDINFAADGGLYAELIKNRSFEFPNAFAGWTIGGNVSLRDDGPFENNPHYVRLAYSGHPVRLTSIANDGFFGIGIEAGREYRFSVWARAVGAPASIRVELADMKAMGENQGFARGDIRIVSGEWQKYTVVLRPHTTVEKASLRIFLNGEAAVDLEHVSLFPTDTWKGRENGLRKDLAQALADMKPGIFRFPGGCIVEGATLETRYSWKNSVGPVENRKLNENRWHYTFDYRFFPDYFQSYGLGFFEFFQLCEDIGAEPLPVISCGMACQFQNGDDAHAGPDEMDEFVQDALDLVQFANGPVTTKWGKLRADMGHPEPFGMKYLAVGNEQWGESYIEHVEPFVEALRKNCPEIQIVGTAGPSSDGEKFDYLWPKMRELKADLVDEHFYNNEEWFINNAARYDRYDRKGPKVFAGEYACHGANGRKWNHFHASLLEAAFMTCLERNADVVRMATYAPLFAHVEGWQWRPDLIWYDNLKSVRSCSYYVQQLYSTNKGTNMLKLLDEDGRPYTGQDGLYASAVWDAGDNSVIVKIININDFSAKVSLDITGMKRNRTLTKATITSFHSDDRYSDNVPHLQPVLEQETILPRTVAENLSSNTLDLDIAPGTFMIYRLY